MSASENTCMKTALMEIAKLRKEQFEKLPVSIREVANCFFKEVRCSQELVQKLDQDAAVRKSTKGNGFPKVVDVIVGYYEHCFVGTIRGVQ